ncbi:hypothetical protein ACIQZO_19945 [Streptomyces sp. NPDC097617]|uniref:hypothetical protein n=1 Tax=Streptomyces sp. NPDC097617 TaxID=3366091 RepID=UPI00382C4B39
MPGLHLEKLENPRDSRIRTLRVSKFMRGVVLAPESGDSFLLLKVMAHGDAIAWALSHRATVNSATQGIELRDDIALERATADVRQAVHVAEERLFAKVSDKELTRLGIDPDLLPSYGTFRGWSLRRERAAGQFVLGPLRPLPGPQQRFPQHVQYRVVVGVDLADDLVQAHAPGVRGVAVAQRDAGGLHRSGHVGQERRTGVERHGCAHGGLPGIGRSGAVVSPPHFEGRAPDH